MPLIYNRTRDITVRALNRIRNPKLKTMAQRRKVAIECLAEQIGEIAVKCWFMLKQDKSAMPISR